MAVLANILPTTLIGSCCLVIFIVLAYYSWKRASRRRLNTRLENPEYEIEEIPGTTDFVMVGRKGHAKKKVKKPKLWEIWVPNFGRKSTHERKTSSGSSFSDLSFSKNVGYWAELKVPTSASLISAESSQLIFALLAHVCNLCQKPGKDPRTTKFHIHRRRVVRPGFRTHNHHRGRWRSHERAGEFFPILALSIPFSRHLITSHPWSSPN
jgi:hypothetical protein